MKLTVFIVITLSMQFVHGQIATIRDSDGWTNVRKSPNGKSEIIHKVYANQLFWYDYEHTDKEQDWISIYIPKNDFGLENTEQTYLVGFIHKSKLLPIDSLKIYSNKEFTFRYILTDFDSTNRIIDKHEGKWVMAIDGRPVWGTDGNFPKTQVSDIEIKIEGQNIKIHKVFYSDIYECDNTFRIYKNEDTYFVHQ